MLGRSKTFGVALLTIAVAMVAAVPAGAVVTSPAVAGAPSGNDVPEVVGIELVGHPDQAGMGRRGMVSIVSEVKASPAASSTMPNAEFYALGRERRG